MPRKWKGDDTHRLPAQQVEPYRLWFEFLKLAAKDPDVQLDRQLYRAWGDFENQKFSAWWSDHWRTLFALDIGVRLVEDPAEIKADGDECLVVRLPLYQAKQKTLRQVADLLDQFGSSERLSDMPQGSFQLSVGQSQNGNPIHPSTRFLRNLDKVRLLYHLYRFWLAQDGLDSRRRLEATAQDYFRWASSWNEMVTTRKWKRSLIEIPPALADYVRWLEFRGDRRKVSLREWNETDVANHRRQLARYIRKAQRIARNVGRGEFPGRYETD